MYLRKKMYSGKRLARGQTHRRGGWRRVISVALCAVLLSTCLLYTSVLLAPVNRVHGMMGKCTVSSQVTRNWKVGRCR